MKLFYRCSLVIVASSLLSCSEDPSNAALQSDTAQQDSSLAQNPSSLKPFEPDANWVTPTETVSQYGPSGIVRDVVIDRDGIIWLAAWDGVISYDGKQFTNHTLKDGLSHHRVYSVMEDSKGNMWFGTMGAGAYKYDGSVFTNYSTNNGMIHNVVFDLFEDKKGNIWFATTTGVSRFDGTSFTNLDSTYGLSQETYAISEDENGVMWFGCETGLFQAPQAVIEGKAKAREFMTSYNTHYANVRDLYWSGTSMYIGCASGFYCTQPNNPNLIVAINQNFTGYIHGSNNGDLILTADGIYRYAPPSFKPHESPSLPWTTIVVDNSSLGIFGAVEAIDGTIWYGAMDGLHSVRDGKDVAYKKP